MACGIFPDQGSNPCPLHWQADFNHCATRVVPFPYFLQDIFNTQGYLAFRGFVVSNINQLWVADRGKGFIGGDWVALTQSR